MRKFIITIFFRVIIILCLGNDKPLCGLSPLRSESYGFSVRCNDHICQEPMYRSLPICHNDFIMNVLVEKSLLKLLRWL